MSGDVGENGPSRATPAHFLETELGDSDGLNTSARLSLLIHVTANGTRWPEAINTLMKANGWTRFHAWRVWNGRSKSEMAARMGIHLATYDLIEDGSVDLGWWLQPAVEWLLSDDR
jgi:DNA-binding XRE family transcriptional regulator